MRSKGISPLIAAVLLIAFTMSIAVLVGPFFSDVLRSAQDSTSSDADSVLKTANSGLEIKQATYNSSSGNYTVSVMNTGETKLENYTITIYSDPPTQKQVNNVLEKNEIDTVTVETSSDGSKADISMDSENISVYAELDAEEISDTGSSDETSTPAFFNLTNVSTDDPSLSGEIFNVTFDVDNIGESQGTQDINLTIDNNLKDSREDLTLNSGEKEEDIKLSWETGCNIYQWNLTSQDDFVNGSISTAC